MQDNKNQVLVSLFPPDLKKIERIDENGDEFLEPELTEQEEFVRSVNALIEERRKEAKKKNSSDSKKWNADSSQNEDETSEASNSKDIEKRDQMEVDDDDEDDEEKEDDAFRAEVDTVDDDDEVDVDDPDNMYNIDPRMHYRDVVTALQASATELHQMINVIDIMRGRDFLEAVHCQREPTLTSNTAKPLATPSGNGSVPPANDCEELQMLCLSKKKQMSNAAQILQKGVDSLTSTVEKERCFFEGTLKLLGKWKICAPTHGNIPKPFRGGESLAIDCSLSSAGSVFSPPTAGKSLQDIAYVKLDRIDSGHVRVKPPESFTPRTIQVTITNNITGKKASYTLPGPTGATSTKWKRKELEKNLDLLEAYNESVLQICQFSVFMEEIFQYVMSEALDDNSSWVSTFYHSKSFASESNNTSNSKRRKLAPPLFSNSSSNIRISHVLEDEVCVQVDENYLLKVQLVYLTDKQPSDSNLDSVGNEDGESDDTNPALQKDKKEQVLFLAHICEYAAMFLQNDVRNFHKRNLKSNISHAAVFASSTSAVDSDHGTIGILESLVKIISHMLVKREITMAMDELANRVILGKCSNRNPATVFFHEDGFGQTLCDSRNSISLLIRWKTPLVFDQNIPSANQLRALSAFDLFIGKYFATEIIVNGNELRYSDKCPPPTTCTSKYNSKVVHELMNFVEETMLRQVLQMLYREAFSFGCGRLELSADHLKLTIYMSKEWDGGERGEGRMQNISSCINYSKKMSMKSIANAAIILEPFWNEEGRISFRCVVKHLDVLCSNEEWRREICQFELKKYQEDDPSISNTNDESQKETPTILHLDWNQIPGHSDQTKLVYLLYKTCIVQAEPVA